MTQSGQGESAREGIVLPSDGGEPLLPSMTGGPVPLPPPNTPGQNPTMAPTGGQAWGGSWGPEQQVPAPGEGWPQAAGQQWGAQGQPGHPAQPVQPAQPGQWNAQAASGTGGTPYAAQQQPYASASPPPQQQHSYGSAPVPQQQPYGSEADQRSYGGDPRQQAYGQEPSSGPLPSGYPQAGAPLPPAADAATQYLRPVPGAPAAVPADEGATQYLPPVPTAPVNEGATQYLPPVPPGALPPETAGHPDAEPTQYIQPVAASYGGGDRQPPSEFDSLFRSDSAGGVPAGATQRMPRVQDAPRVPRAQSHPQQSYTPQPSYTPQASDDDGGGGSGSGRNRSKVPLIAAIGIGLVVVGVGAGALLNTGGGDGGGQKNDGKTVAASASVTSGESASPAADPVRAQAVALDKLLADSGGSRTSVINAVGDVRGCDNLSSAASDLREAAKQRGELVTRLSKLSVDKLPDNAALTTALTKAWQASASADNHYAAWAGQVSGKHGCKKGHARTTGQTQAGNRASGVASTQKATAARLWNTIASKYGLTERQPTQL